MVIKLADGKIRSVLLRRNLGYQIKAQPQNLPSHLVNQDWTAACQTQGQQSAGEWHGSGMGLECHADGLA